MQRLEVTQAVNAEYLRAQMLRHLFASQAASAIDVGCGRGQLLERCRAKGLWSVGLEGSAKRVGELTQPVVQGSATALPFAAGCFDWSIMRHVPHHLDDPAAATGELARVAARGVLLAEPWRPAGDPASETAHLIDEWCKAHHRRTGMIHDSDIPGEQLAEWLKAADNFEIEIEHVHRPLNLPLEEVTAGIWSSIEDLPEEHEERRQAREWIRRIKKTGFSATGSVILVARKLA